MIADTFYLASPVFNQDNTFVVNMWTFPNSLVINTMLLALEYIYLTYGVSIVIGYDFLYLSLLIDVVTQIKLLKFKLMFGKLKSKNDILKILYSCIEHHQFLLS